MPVDEQVQQVLECFATLGAPPLTTLSPEEARQRPTIADAVDELQERRGETGEPEAVSNVHDEMIQGPAGDIRARIYRPEAEGPLPMLMYFHAGGWVLGDLERGDGTCRAMANLAQCVVVSVGYRLAPEHPFPAAVQDAYAATQWAVAASPSLGGDPTRLAVSGEGAGGNLAAVVTQMARDSNTHMPIYQVLIYPILNDAFDTPSYIHSAHVRPLTREEMRWYWNHYLPEPAAGANEYASPLRAEELAGLPAGLIVTAEYDVLRDEGEAYGRRLEEAGVPMVIRRYAGMVHGFLEMAPVVEDACNALREIAGWLRSAFSLPSAGAEQPGLSRAEAPLVEVQEGLSMANIGAEVTGAPLMQTPEEAENHMVGNASLHEDAGRDEMAPTAAAEESASAAPAASEVSEATPRAPLESGVVVRVGMEVVDAQGHHMGKVKAVRASDFVVDRRFRRDIALPFQAIQMTGERVVLNVPAKDATKIDWSQPSA